MRPSLLLVVICLACMCSITIASPLQEFDNSLVIAPLYPQYMTDSEETFARQVQELKTRLGLAPHVVLGFSAGLNIAFPPVNIDEQLGPAALQSTFQDLDAIIDR